MELRDRVWAARDALARARSGEAERIAAAVRANGVVGVLGEGEVGKTTTIEQAVRRPQPDLMTIYVDLDGVASEAHLAFDLAREIARGLLGRASHSVLAAGGVTPRAIAGQGVELAELLGVDGMEEALREWPSGHYALDDALAGVESLAHRFGVLLWLDHVEAPALTPRHPLAIGRILWGIRDAAQRVEGLSLLISAREGTQGSLLGRDAAFHQQGEWLTLANPPSAAWQEVAQQLGIPGQTAEWLADLTRGHPATMLLALLHLEEHPHEPAADVLRRLATLDPGLMPRSAQHARSLHRLGGQVLEQVALGLGPYAAAQRGASSQQEITKVLGRLRLAGLVRHDRGWSPVNPLLRISLTEQVQPVSAPGLETTRLSESKPC